MKRRPGFSGEWECPDCGNIRVDHGSDEYEYDNLYNGRPNYCKSCDCNMYPICIDGCPLANK